MKRLVLVRHAKAVHWGYDNDFSRELTDRGESDAAKVSAYLRKEGILPSLIISSPAARALQTAMIFAEAFEYPGKDIRKDHELYNGYDTSEFLDMLHTTPDEWEVVFVFGHNPTMENFASGLCTYFGREVPTCSAMVIDFETDSWEAVEVRTGNLFIQVNPKAL